MRKGITFTNSIVRSVIVVSCYLAVRDGASAGLANGSNRAPLYFAKISPKYRHYFKLKIKMLINQIDW